MKKCTLVLLIILVAAVCSADPGPEIVVDGNWCHFVLSADNGNNEVFASGCGGDVIADGNNGATGYALKTKRFKSKSDIAAHFGSEKVDILVTSAESENTCELVDSNGTQYNSNNWVTRVYSRGPFVFYYLSCLDGVQQQQQ